MEEVHHVLVMLERALVQCSLPFCDAKRLFKDHQADQAIDRRSRTTETKVKENKCSLNRPQEQYQPRHDLRTASVSNATTNYSSFIKERRVYVGARESIDRNAISDVYVHVRAWQYELKQGRTHAPAVPHVCSVYGYWDEKKKEFWIGVEQEALLPATTLFARITQGLVAGTAEEVARVALIKLLTALRRFQEEFWLVHNDLHLNNVFMRNDGTPVIIDFDHASYYLEGTNGRAICYTYYHYQHSSIWARDVQQLMNDVLHALTNGERDMLDTHPFLNKLRALGSTYGSAETDNFRSYLEYSIRTLKKPEAIERARWFLKNPRGTLRAISPATIQFGIVGEFYNAADVARVLVTDVSQFETMEEVMKCESAGAASDWALLEYVSKTLPTVGSAAEMAEWQWAPLLKGAGSNDINAWQDLDFKNFVDIWTRYNLGPLWLNADFWFSMGPKSVPKNRRVLYFTVALENLQRVAALFYLARSRFDKIGAFYLMYACHIALFGQSPFCSYEAMHRILWEGKGSAPEYTRENLPEAAGRLLVQYVHLDVRSWSIFTKNMYELAAEIRTAFMADIFTARSKLMAVGSIRALFGHERFEQFVVSCGHEQEVESATTGACLAAVHPDVLGARDLTIETWFEKIHVSERSFKTKIGTNCSVPQTSRFGANL